VLKGLAVLGVLKGLAVLGVLKVLGGYEVRKAYESSCSLTLESESIP
jgi:hypothetical protein